MPSSTKNNSRLFPVIMEHTGNPRPRLKVEYTNSGIVQRFLKRRIPYCVHTIFLLTLLSHSIVLAPLFVI